MTTEIVSAILLFIAGLVFFLFGMDIMSDNLKKLAGGKMEKTLKKMTSNPLKALALGAGITAVIQSSSAMTATPYCLARRPMAATSSGRSR